MSKLPRAAPISNVRLQEERKSKLRERGDAKTQTSDARFDAQFAVMHGFAGKTPWYAKDPGSSLLQVGKDVRSRAGEAGTSSAELGSPRGAYESRLTKASGERGRRERSCSRRRSRSSSSSSSSTSHDARRRSKSAKRKSRKHHRRKRRRRHRSDTGSDSRSASPAPHVGAAARPRAGKSIAELRAERLQREQADAARSRALLRQRFGERPT